jgi:hypothetical protein
VHRSKWEQTVSKRRFRISAAVLMTVSLVSAPAFATRDLTAQGPAGLAQTTPVFGTSLHGEARSSKAVHSTQLSAKPATSSVPEAAAWLLMLAGFGLLGVATRRGTPHPLEQQQLA